MNRNHLKMGIGFGGPTVLMIFVALCLTTLGALALITARSDWTLTRKAAEAAAAYYRADCEAEEALAEEDARRAEGLPVLQPVRRFPVSDNLALVMTVRQEDGRIRAVSRRTEVLREWDYEAYQTEFGQVRIPEEKGK